MDDPSRAAGERTRLGAVHPLGVLAEAVRMWSSHAPFYAGLSALFHAPVAVALVVGTWDPRKAAFWLVFGVLPLGTVATNPLSLAAWSHVHGKRASFATCVREGTTRFLRPLGVWMIGFLPFVFATAFCAIALASSEGLAGSGKGTMVLAIAFVVLVVLWLFARRWVVAVPALAVERLTASDATDRSAALAAGNSMRVLVVFVVVVLIEVAAWYVALRWPARGGDWQTPLGYALAARVFLFVPLRAVACTVTYAELRVSHEGVVVGEIARVFD